VGTSICDDKGTCANGPTIVCAPFACDPTTATCKATCASDADCFNRSCINGSCGFIPVGAKCSVGADCASGFCSDGQCCNVACQGACVSCSLPGRVGTCWPVDVGVLDPRAVCTDHGAASCGTNGRCDGFGACAIYALGTTCSAPSCSGGTLALSGQCNALAACIVRFASCAPYACRDDAPMCHSDCAAGDSICAAGSYCGGDEVCVAKKPAGTPCQSNHECLSNLCPPAPQGAVSVCMSLI
jgi:hypothetical protein